MSRSTTRHQASSIAVDCQAPSTADVCQVSVGKASHSVRSSETLLAEGGNVKDHASVSQQVESLSGDILEVLHSTDSHVSHSDPSEPTSVGGHVSASQEGLPSAVSASHGLQLTSKAVLLVY